MTKIRKAAVQYAAKGTNLLRVGVVKKIYRPISSMGRGFANTLNPMATVLSNVDDALKYTGTVKTKLRGLAQVVAKAIQGVATILPHYLVKGYRTSVTAIRSTDDFLFDLTGVAKVNVSVWKAVLIAVSLGLFALFAMRDLFAL